MAVSSNKIHKLPLLYRKTFKKPVRVYWWRHSQKTVNFGDEITPYLVKNLFGLEYAWAAPKDCEIAGAGSIIEHLQERSEGNSVKVWGSGFIRPGPSAYDKNLDFLAVRGSASQKRIIKDVPHGDPGLLLPLAFQMNSTKKYRIGILPHYVDADLDVVHKLSCLPGSKVINVLQSAENVIKELSECELVISSSLHGLIVSDAYGIPNVWLPMSDGLTGGDYKFKDYYSVFGRTPKPVSISDLSAAQIDEITHRYAPVNKDDLAKIQSGLIESFRLHW